MLDLFNEPSGRNHRTVANPRFDYVRRAHQSNLDRVIDHYRKNHYAVKSDHLLVQLIQSIPVEVRTPLEEFKLRVEAMADDIIRPFGLVSGSHVGEMREISDLYGEECQDLVILDETSFSPGEVRNRWFEMEPVRFLRHPKSNLNMEVPLGESVPGEKGINVYTVNLAKLACQWRQWRLRELEENPDYPGSAMQFVSQFPLPNALRSQVDVAFLNMLRKEFKGEEIQKVSDYHPFFFNDRFDKTLEGLQKTNKAYTDRKTSFEDFLEIVRPIHAKNLREVVALPSLVPTRQITAAFTLARLPLVAFLLQWHEYSGSQRSRQEINDFRRSIRRIHNDRVMSEILGSEHLKEVKDYIEMEVWPYL